MAWPLAAALCVLVLGPLMGLGLELLARRLMTGRSHAADRVDDRSRAVGRGDRRRLVQRREWQLPAVSAHRDGRIVDVNVQWQQIIVAIGRADRGRRALLLPPLLPASAPRCAPWSTIPSCLSVTGESPARVRRWAWMIGSSFAALSGLLIAPSLPISALVLTLLVVQAFGAAAIGYFSNLPLTYVGGLAIGIAGAIGHQVRGRRAVADRSARRASRSSSSSSCCSSRHGTSSRRAASSTHAPSRPTGTRRCGCASSRGIAVRRPSSASSRTLVGTKLASYSSALVLVILILSLGLLVRTSRQVSLCQYAFAAIGASSMAHFTTDHGSPGCSRCCSPGWSWCRSGRSSRFPRSASPACSSRSRRSASGSCSSRWCTRRTSCSVRPPRASRPPARASISVRSHGGDEGMYFVILAFVVVTARRGRRPHRDAARQAAAGDGRLAARARDLWAQRERHPRARVLHLRVHRRRPRAR